MPRTRKRRMMIARSFADRTAVVVGASSGIGAAISRDLADAGARVILVGRDLERLQAVAAYSAEAVPLVADVSKPSECRGLAERVRAVAPKVDHLVVSSGVFSSGPVEEMTEEECDRVMDTNVKAPLFLVQSFLSCLRSAGGGSVVVMSSALAHVAAPNLSLYCMSKGAVSSLVRALAVELAADDIRVNAVSPGHVATPMTSEILNCLDARRAVAQHYPLNRIGEPEDIASLVLFLLSDNASWITGVDYIIDGGRLASG